MKNIKASNPTDIAAIKESLSPTQLAVQLVLTLCPPLPMSHNKLTTFDTGDANDCLFLLFGLFFPLRNSAWNL